MILMWMRRENWSTYSRLMLQVKKTIDILMTWLLLIPHITQTCIIWYLHFLLEWTIIYKVSFLELPSYWMRGPSHMNGCSRHFFKRWEEKRPDLLSLMRLLAWGCPSKPCFQNQFIDYACGIWRKLVKRLAHQQEMIIIFGLDWMLVRPYVP
jgi:hypothetical protein